MEECFQPAVNQLRQIAKEAVNTPGRVIHCQEGAALGHQRRIRVISGFSTPQQQTLAEAISDIGAAEAVTNALSIQFGIADIVEGGTFDEQKVTVRYRRPRVTKETNTPLRETSFIETPPSPSLRVRRSDSLLPRIDQLRLRAQEMEVTPGRVISVEQGGSLDQKRRVTVFDDFNTSYQNPIARVVCTESVTEAIASCLMIQFGAHDIILSRDRFVEEKAGLRYQIPQSPSSTKGRYSYNIVSEDTPSKARGRG